MTRQQVVTMSFYHVLTSDGALDTYPMNHASSFSTPIENPYILEGNWEVALINATHSNCINTFANDKLEITENFKDYSALQKVNEPVKVFVTLPTPANDYQTFIAIANNINYKFYGLLNFKINVSHDRQVTFLKRKITTPDFFFILSEKLRDIFQLDSDVLSPWDNETKRFINLRRTIQVESPDELHITIVPMTFARKSITIKKSNEELNISSVIQNFNDLMKVDGRQIATFQLTTNYVVLEKLYNDNFVLLCSKDLHAAMLHTQSGFFKVNKHSFLPYDLSRSYKFDFVVHLIEIKAPTLYNFSLTKSITLKRQQFLTTKDAIDYINDNIADERIRLQCIANDIVKLKIANEDLSITFDVNLRDILGFDKTFYRGKGEFASSAPISLIRRIQYFYIYSDMCDMVRVGDTQAPLLAVLPYNAKDCKLLSEKRFQLPMYVPVKKTYLSEILIGLYDDAGKQIPFHRDAVTTLRLHFRKCH